MEPSSLNLAAWTFFFSIPELGTILISMRKNIYNLKIVEREAKFKKHFLLDMMFVIFRILTERALSCSPVLQAESSLPLGGKRTCKYADTLITRLCYMEKVKVFCRHN